MLLKPELAAAKQRPLRSKMPRGILVGGILLVLLIFALGMAACGTGDDATPTKSAGPAQTAPPGVEPTPDPQTLWNNSPHADTYVSPENGKNMSCARCHSYVNWMPSMDELPETCFVCKFEVAPPPPSVAQDEWLNVTCMICHEVDDGEVDSQYRWLDIAPLEEYIDVSSPSSLCKKCHADPDVPDHIYFELGGAHEGYECTDCHNPHSAEASCGAAGCHEEVVDLAALIPGHDETHQIVSCAACHDVEGLEVGPNEEGLWVTIPYLSHNVALEAPCDRCHYPANPWGLTEETP